MSATQIRVQWSPHPSARRYRLVLRDAVQKTIVFQSEVIDPNAAIPASAVADNKRHEWRVRVQLDGTGSWTEFLPYQTLDQAERAADKFVRLEWAGEPGPSGLYRVVVRDDAAIRFTAIAQEPHYLLNRLRLTPNVRYRWKIQTHNDEGKWADLTKYVIVPAQSKLPAAVRRPAAAASPANDSSYFLFTVDTEANMRNMFRPNPQRAVDEQVFGRCENGEFGIVWMMNELDAHGLKGTFFVDILMHYQFGREGLERTVDAIRQRGHDIQLHLHPDPHFYFSADTRHLKLIGALDSNDPDLFRRTLEIAVSTFDEVVGHPPLAYRGGSYRIQPIAFPILAEFGIKFDSTVYAFKNCHAPPWLRTRTNPLLIDGVIELPVTWYAEHRDCGLTERQFNLRVGGDTAMKAILNDDVPVAQRPRATVFMAHSYSFLTEDRSRSEKELIRWNAEFKAVCPPQFYESLTRTEANRPIPLYSAEDGRTAVFRELVPDDRRIALFRELLSHLKSQSSVTTTTFSGLEGESTDTLVGEQSFDPLSCWDHRTRSCRSLATRRYSAGYLGSLETAAVRS